MADKPGLGIEDWGFAEANPSSAVPNPESRIRISTPDALPFCQHVDTKVIDSRASEDGATIRRRRECEACGERFSTLETVELKLPAIIKGDGRRENFDARASCA